MIKTQYIRVRTTPADDKKGPNKSKRDEITQQDKIARLYALAKEYHIKIGG